jgi:hypothetical protein
MRIGIVVDGVSEFRSLGQLYADLEVLTGNQFLAPLHADIQPHAPVGTIAKQCSASINQLFGRNADRVILLFDRETRSECPGTLAQAVERKIRREGVRVVVKDRAFENWVIADLAALRKQPKRFEVSKATARAVQPDKADRVDALALLKRAAIKDAYDKVEDSKRVLTVADASSIGAHSRSFRRFLRCVGCVLYAHQSSNPA